MKSCIGYLKKDEQYKTLASIAQTSHGLYQLATPKVYETITVTEENQKSLVYGHSLAQGSTAEGNSKGQEKARKDLATVHTRKVILETIPTAPVWDCYPAIKEVIIKAVCHAERDVDDSDYNKRIPDDEYVPPPIYDTLAAYSLKHAGPEPLHVDIQDSRSIAFSRLKLIANREKEKVEAGEPHDRITYGFHGLQKDCIYRIIGAYMLRGVVSFWDLEARKAGSYAAYFADMMRDCFKKDRIGMGRLYMCGVPELVLLPNEIAYYEEDVNEAALRRIWESWVEQPWDRVPKPKWEEFIARFHLVDRSYRRSMADVTQSHQQYLKDPEEGPIFWQEILQMTCCRRDSRVTGPMPEYWHEV